jgi:hypothetical protein
MRFLVTVHRPSSADPWEVTITSVPGQGAAAPPSRTWTRIMDAVGDDDEGWLPVRPAGSLADEPALSDLSTASAGEIREVYDHITARDAQPGEVVRYGRYLFDVLIGAKIWDEIVAMPVADGETHIELALCWDWKDGHLSRLHWEMMATAERFLASGLPAGALIRDVAITRIVPNSTTPARPPSDIPRVLFVVGASLLDRKIRPGAEIIGILQQPGSDSRIRWRVVEQAKPSAIEREIKSFAPDVVHFICHGAIDGASGEAQLKLQPEQERGDDMFPAAQIMAWLGAAGTLPAMVVLSACQSAASGSTLGPQVVAPLAADLVARGVPIAIGMSGHVSDVACRLFTRRFAEVLMRCPHETLVRATALGRRAAFAMGNDPGTSVDWGFPTVFLSAKVDPAYTPSTEPPPGSVSIEDRLVPYILRRDPVFCGRREFFDEFRLLMEGAYRALGACVDTDAPGYGRTRLLEALTIQALVDGHVPVAVLARDHKWTTPTNALELGLAIDRAIEVARQSLGLAWRSNDRPMFLLEAYHDARLELEDLPTKLRRAVKLGRRGKGDHASRPVPAQAVTLALEAQFAELIRKARGEKPALAGPASRVVLLLDEVHEYIELLDDLFDERFGGHGFGTLEEPVPMVLAFSLMTTRRELLKEIAENRLPNVCCRPLAAFRREDGFREDMQVYARVLMNPFDKKLAPKFSDVAWVINYDAPDNAIEHFEEKYRNWFEGIPAELSHRQFYMVLDDPRADRFVKKADDADRLKQLMQDRA